MFFQIQGPPTKEEEEEDNFWATPEQRFEPPSFQIREEDVTTTTLEPLQPPVTTPSTTSPMPNNGEMSSETLEASQQNLLVSYLERRFVDATLFNFCKLGRLCHRALKT